MPTAIRHVNDQDYTAWKQTFGEPPGSGETTKAVRHLKNVVSDEQPQLVPDGNIRISAEARPRIF